MSLRIIIARFNTKYQKTKVVLDSTPTNNASEKEKEEFYDSLQTIVISIPKRGILMVMGDMNAKVGANGERERERCSQMKLEK